MRPGTAVGAILAGYHGPAGGKRPFAQVLVMGLGKAGKRPSLRVGDAVGTGRGNGKI